MTRKAETYRWYRRELKKGRAPSIASLQADHFGYGTFVEPVVKRTRKKRPVMTINVPATSLPEGFVGHVGRHVDRLSRSNGHYSKLEVFNTQRIKDGLPILIATKGWDAPKRKLVPGYKPPEPSKHIAGTATQNEAQRPLYSFMGYW